MILKIRQVGELVLRQKSRPLSVEEISSQYVRHLIESMRKPCMTLQAWDWQRRKSAYRWNL